MPLPLVTGSLLTCSFGVAPSALVVIPTGAPVLTENRPQATVMDHQPMANIPPFGVCMSLANPMVAAATAAALGVLTPMPCIPVVPAPWVPIDPMVLVGGQPALLAGSICTCVYGGVINVMMPGTAITDMA